MPYCSGEDCWRQLPCPVHPEAGEKEEVDKSAKSDSKASRSRSKSRSKARSSKKHKKRSRSVDKKKKRSRSKSKRKEKKAKREKSRSKSRNKDKKASRDPSPAAEPKRSNDAKVKQEPQEKEKESKATSRSRSRSKSPKRSRSKQRSGSRSRRKKEKKKERSSRRSRSRSPRRRSRSRTPRRRTRSRSPKASRTKSGRKLAFDPEALNGALAIASGVLNGTANPAAASALLMQQMQCANPQATRQARRLYIGNMPTGAGITESMLLEFFTTTVISLGITTTQPVLSVWCSSEGTFCFVEFRSIKDATTCLSLLQGITLGGRVLNVGRPADYKAPPSYLENFVVGLSPDAYVLPPPAPNGPVGLLGLKLPLPGMPHVVPSTPASVPPNALGLTMLPSAAPVASSATAAIASAAVSEVLMLVNMVEEQELLENEDFEDLVLDVREECERYGPVLEIVIPRVLPTDESTMTDIDGKLPNSNDSGPRVGQGVGRVFARFASSEDCAKAKNAIDGRLFNNNRVGASFWDLSKFNSKIYV